MLKKLLVFIATATISFAMGGGPALVNTAPVTKGVVNPLEEFIGTLEFSKSSALASQSNGAVVKVNFEAGDIVQKGDVIALIDSRILDTQITSAKVTSADAKKNFERYKRLKDTTSVSQKVYDDSYLKYITSKATFQSLQTQKEQKSIKAPFDGVIVEKNIEVGEWLNSGKVVAKIVNTNSLNLIFNLPTSYIYKLSQKANYDISLGNIKVSSKLYATIAKGDKLTRTFPVKFKAMAKGNNQFLYDGMEAKIKLPRAKEVESLIVPRDAVIKRFGQDVIFADVDGKAVMMPVQIIGYNKENAAIATKGLVEGMKVVVKGNERIFPNQPIKSLDK